MATNVRDFGEGVLTFGGSDYICQVEACTLVASNTRQDIVTACGTTSRFINEQFELRVRFLQDWTSAGVSKYLWDHYNTDVAFTFSTDPDDTPLMSGTLTIPRPSFGGETQQPLRDDQTFPVVGIPTLTADV